MIFTPIGPYSANTTSGRTFFRRRTNALVNRSCFERRLFASSAGFHQTLRACAFSASKTLNRESMTVERAGKRSTCERMNDVLATPSCPCGTAIPILVSCTWGGVMGMIRITGKV